jgi:hypothetical protein
MHIFLRRFICTTSASDLRFLYVHEDGGVILRKRTAPENAQTIEGRGWEVSWKSKLHVESDSLKYGTVS